MSFKSSNKSIPHQTFCVGTVYRYVFKLARIYYFLIDFQ